MTEINRARLRALMDEKNETPRSLSRAVGTNDYLVRDIMSGKSKNPRLDTIKKIADYLRVPLSELMPPAVVSRVSATDERSIKLVPNHLPVRYRVQAGLWFETDDYAQDYVGPPKPVAADPRFAEFPQWLELVQGDSIDRIIPDGGYAHVVDAIEMGYAPRSKDLVVVERRRSGGLLRERTIKEVMIADDGAIELWPRSSNARWNAPIRVADGGRDGEDIEVEIVGLVLGSYSSYR